MRTVSICQTVSLYWLQVIDLYGAFIMDREQIAALLKARGVLPTAQRLDVGEMILSEPQHLSADQIQVRLRNQGSKISKATIYNTLNLFCEKGLLRTVKVDPTRQFYDSTTADHYHFFNEDTGELVDIDPQGLDLTGLPELPPGTEHSGLDLVVRVRNRTIP